MWPGCPPSHKEGACPWDQQRSEGACAWDQQRSEGAWDQQRSEGACAWDQQRSDHGACTWDQQRSDHGAGTFTHHAALQTPSSVDHGVRQMASGGHCAARESVLCERTAQNTPMQSDGEKPWLVSQSAQPCHSGLISNLGNNHQRMSAEGDGELHSKYIALSSSGIRKASYSMINNAVPTSMLHLNPASSSSCNSAVAVAPSLSLSGTLSPSLSVAPSLLQSNPLLLKLLQRLERCREGQQGNTEDVCLKADDTADASDSIPEERDTVCPAGQRQEDKETEYPAGDLSPVKISVLSAKKAKEIFDLHQKESNHQLMFLRAPLSANNREVGARLPENQKEQLTEDPSLIKDPKYDITAASSSSCNSAVAPSLHRSNPLLRKLLHREGQQGNASSQPPVRRDGCLEKNMPRVGTQDPDCRFTVIALPRLGSNRVDPEAQYGLPLGSLSRRGSNQVDPETQYGPVDPETQYGPPLGSLSRRGSNQVDPETQYGLPLGSLSRRGSNQVDPETQYGPVDPETQYGPPLGSLSRRGSNQVDPETQYGPPLGSLSRRGSNRVDPETQYGPPLGSLSRRGSNQVDPETQYGPVDPETQYGLPLGSLSRRGSNQVDPETQYGLPLGSFSRRGSKRVDPETQYGPPLGSLSERSTENNSALEKEVYTDSQLLDYIYRKVEDIKNLARNENNGEYERSDSEERIVGLSEEDPSYYLTNVTNAEKMERRGLSRQGPEPSLAADEEAYEEDGTKEDCANTLLTQIIKESDNCAKSTLGKCWESGRPIPAENSSCPHTVKSADQKSPSPGFVSPVKKPSDVTVSLDCDNQVSDSHNCREDKTCDISEDESYNGKYCGKTSKNVLFTVPTLLYTSVALKQLVASVQDAEAPVVPRDNIRDFIIQNYWNGDVRRLCVFITTESPQILIDVAATCTKNEYESPVVLSAITGMTFDELVKEYPTLTTLINYTPSQEEYKSFWLNINEHVDDLDKEPGVAWCFTLEEAGEDVCLEADATAEERDTVCPAGQRQEDRETESPAGDLSPVKISVLSAKKAKEIFDLHQKESNHQLMFLRAPLSEKNREVGAHLPKNQKEQLTEAPSLIKDPRYEDITDEDTLKYEDITDDYTETTDQENELGADSVNCQKPAPPCRNQDDGRKRAITEMTSNNQELRDVEMDALKQTCCCPYLVETEEGFQNRLCPTCETKTEFGMKSSHISSAVFKELDLVPAPVSGVFYPLSDDGISLNRDTAKAPKVSQTDAKDFKSVTKAETSQRERMAKTEASLKEQGLEHEGPQCEHFIDVDHKDPSVDETSQNEETSMTGDKDFQYRDEEEDDEDDDDDWMVIPVAVSDLAYEPTDGDPVWPENALPQDVENGKKQDDDVIVLPLCDAQDSTSKPCLPPTLSPIPPLSLSTGLPSRNKAGKKTPKNKSLKPSSFSPSADIEVFESRDGFLKANNIDYVHCHIFTAPGEDDIQTGDQNPRPQISCESEPEQMKRWASTSETERSSDYSTASPKNYLTVSKKCFKKRLRPNRFRVFSESDSEDQEGDDMSNVPQSRPLPDCDSESEDDECTNNVHKRQKRKLSTTTESEDSSVESVSMVTNGESAESKTDTNVIQCRSKRLKIPTGKHTATAESDYRPERYSEKTRRTEGKLLRTLSQDESVTSAAAALVDDRRREEGGRSLERARLSPEILTEDSSDDGESAESKTDTNVIQCLKILSGKHTATAESESRPERYSEKTRRTDGKLLRTLSPDESVTSAAAALVDDRRREEGGRSLERARLSPEILTEDSSDDGESAESKTDTNVIQCLKILSGKHTATAESESRPERYSEKTRRTDGKLLRTLSPDESVTSAAAALVDDRRREEGGRSLERARLSPEILTEDSSDDSAVQQRRCWSTERVCAPAPLAVRRISEQASPGFTSSVKPSKASTVHTHSKTQDNQMQTKSTMSEHSNLLSQRKGSHGGGELRNTSCSKTRERVDKVKEGNKGEKDEQRKKENRLSKVPTKTKTSECGAQGTTRRQISTSRECLSTLKQVPSPSREGLTNSTEGSPSIGGISARATFRRQMTTSREGQCTLKQVPSPSREGLTNSTEGSPSIGGISARATFRRQMTTSREGQCTLKQVPSPSREGLSNSTEGSPSIGGISARATFRRQMSTSREVLSPSIKCIPTSSQGSSSREHLSQSREGKTSREYLSVSREGPSTSGEGTTSSRKSVSKSREDSHSSECGEGWSTSGKAESSARQSLSKSREDFSSSRHNLSKSREGMSTSKEGSNSFPPISRAGSSTSIEGFSKSGGSLSTSRKGLKVKIGDDLSSEDCLPKSSEGLSASREHFSECRKTPLAYRRNFNVTKDHPSSSSCERPSTSRQTLSTGRQLAHSLWEPSYYPTPRDRRTSCGEETVRPSPPQSKYSHRDAEREAGPRRRHTSQGSVPLLMKRSRDEAKRWTKTRRPEGPAERRRSVGEGYKWKDGRSFETKGREGTELGSSPEQYY